MHLCNVDKYHVNMLENPLVERCLTREFQIPAPLVQNPCNPSPCGPNSHCREINGLAVCSCVQGYIGSPPTCQPECVQNSDCSQTEACFNQKCQDPCPGVCGVNAKCTVVNHNPICNCPRRYSGDPFTRCQPIGILLYFNSPS